MEIKYLTKLEKPKAKHPKQELEDSGNEPMSISEIEQLELVYNNGRLFPKVLRELLYLAGNCCKALGLYDLYDTVEVQEEARDLLKEESLSIDRPFYVIDLIVEADSFVFIYLDEGKKLEDPFIYHACFHEDPFITSSERTLSSFIDITYSDYQKILHNKRNK